MFSKLQVKHCIQAILTANFVSVHGAYVCVCVCVCLVYAHAYRLTHHML
jgi:hypothetical protein